MGDERPIKQDKPVLDQPPPLLDLVSYTYLDRDGLSDSLELREDVLCRSMIRHNPERQQKCKEPKDVEEQNKVLGEGKVLREVNVEAHGEHNEQENCQGRLPGETVVDRIMPELNERFDDAGELQTTSRDTGDPAQTTKPADDERQRFLQWSWSEFADEVVLACEC